MNRGNQPVLVSRNIEHKIIPCLVDRIERPLQFGEIAVLTSFDDAPPPSQRRFSNRMDFCEVAQSFVADQDEVFTAALVQFLARVG